MEDEKEEDEAELVVVSTISFIQTNMQRNIGVPGIFTRTVVVKVIDMALAQEPWYRENGIRGLSSI